ncbi:hypothetical protein [Nostoc sp.]
MMRRILDTMLISEFCTECGVTLEEVDRSPGMALDASFQSL